MTTSLLDSKSRAYISNRPKLYSTPPLSFASGNAKAPHNLHNKHLYIHLGTFILFRNIKNKKYFKFNSYSYENKVDYFIIRRANGPYPTCST